MLLVVLAGFILPLLLLIIATKRLKSIYNWLFLLPAGLFAYFILQIGSLGDSGQYFSYEWVPSLGINADFKLDGLSMLFSLLITGVGTLVFIYTSSYLKGHKYLDRFYAYLSIFMASMLGLVLSDNLLSLFIFWELTSISSFFLIGFNNDDPASRKSSLVALGITGGGGFFLLTGFLLMGSISGTYSIQEMLSSTEAFQSHGMYGWILFFVFMGAFTKSAQFPFHFWLPGAMKAPTPVSTYLHSATMVKAGIYLLARFTPLLGGDPYWNYTLLIVGGFTMLFAAFHSLFRTDLKGILAYSTISALGILVFLLGLGNKYALLAASVFILVHALYKASLFLITGIIDHETGTRDVTQLAGLRKVLLPVGIAGGLAALSSAGLPPFFGFVGKDLIYEATLSAGNSVVLWTGLAILTNVFLLYAGFQAGIRPFIGALPAKFEKLHLPHFTMWVPPLLLATLGLLFGIAPVLIDQALVQPMFTSMYGDISSTPLKLWHGFNTVLALSGLTLALGFALYFTLKPSQKLEKRIAKLDFIAPLKLALDSSRLLMRFAKRYTGILQNGLLRNYVLTTIGFLILIFGYKIYNGISINVDFASLTEVTTYEFMIFGIMIAAIFMAVFSTSRVAAIASMGVVGFSICLMFVFFSAPDLAMTQFAIETLTVILFLLIIFRLPKYLKYSNPPMRIRDGAFAVVFGALITIVALEVLTEKVNGETSRYYADNAYVLAKGKNVVNVILVDFRGIDTLVEITVLSIAAIGVYSLLKFRKEDETDLGGTGDLN